MGKNYDSKTNQWKPLKGEDTIKLSAEVRRLKVSGMSASDIAERIDRSVTRVYQLLKD